MTMGAHIVGMEVTGVDDNVTKVTLTGRLDTPGVEDIETRFVASLVPAGKSAIVDLSGVEFVASMGIRMLITVARSLHQRHARLVLYGPQSMVKKTLETVSLSEIIPIVGDQAEAIDAVSS